MKQKLLSVLLVLAMALTMLPTAAFAEETATPAVSGYGFVWKGGEHKDDLVEGATTSGDWMGETMYVYFADAPAANVNLWFQVKVGDHTWGCAASGGSKTYAFSFLNRGSQWELHPTIDNEKFDYSNKDVTHATTYMNAGEVTLEVFTPTNAIQGAQETAPSADTLGKAIFTQKITIAKDTDVKETVGPETSDKTKLGAGTVSGAILNQADDAVKNIKVTAKAGTADSDGVIPVALTASATIPTHKNGENKDGVWVGFALAAPEGAAKVKYAFSPSALTASSELTETELEANVAGDKSGIAFYANKSDESPKIYAAVQWIPAENDTTHTASDVTVYKMDLSEINKPETPVDPPTEGTLKFAALSDNFIFSGMGDKAVSDLVETGLKVSEPDANKVVKVTGIAKYAAWAEFNGNTEDKEQEGHYLPIQIKGVEGQKITIKGLKEKEFTFGSDGSCELAMFLDKLTESKFTVTVGEVVTSSKKAGDIYTIDCSGVTLLPKAADGTKVEATTDAEGNTTIKASDTAGKVTVALPAETAEGLTGNTIKVENKASFANVDLAQDTNEAVSTVVKTASAGAAVTVTNSDGEEVKVSGEAVITITIKVEDAGTYHVFCIDNDGRVTSFGEYTADATTKTLTIKSTHLSQYPAVKITEDNKAAVDAAAKLVDQDEGKVDGDAPVTPGSIVVDSAVVSGAIGRKVTVTGLTAENVTVQIAKPGNTAPAVVFNIPKATAVNGFNVNAGSVVTVWNGEVTFVNGAPSNPPAASTPYTVPANG
jgi:hypothetical protein